MENVILIILLITLLICSSQRLDKMEDIVLWLLSCLKGCPVGGGWVVHLIVFQLVGGCRFVYCKDVFLCCNGLFQDITIFWFGVVVFVSQRY